jgi:putative FmdB family regulatory protein
MPTYEYACAKCGKQFEKFQPIADKALTVCPKENCCRKTWGKGRVTRVIGAGAGLIFKGSGFYITDSRSEKYKAAAKKESSATDAKPAPAKAEAKPAAPATKKA